MSSPWISSITLRAGAVVLLGSWCIGCANTPPVHTREPAKQPDHKPDQKPGQEQKLSGPGEGDAGSALAAQPQPDMPAQPRFLGNDAPACWPAEGALLRWTPSGPGLNQALDTWGPPWESTYRCGSFDAVTGTVPIEIRTEHVRLIGHIAADDLMDATARSWDLYVTLEGKVRYSSGLRVRRSEDDTYVTVDDGFMEVYLPAAEVQLARTFPPDDTFLVDLDPEGITVNSLMIFDAPHGRLLATLTKRPLGAVYPYRVRPLGVEQDGMVPVYASGGYVNVHGWASAHELYARRMYVTYGFGAGPPYPTATFAAGAPLFDRKDGMIVGRVVQETKFDVQQPEGDDGWCRVHSDAVPYIELWAPCREVTDREATKKKRRPLPSPG